MVGDGAETLASLREENARLRAELARFRPEPQNAGDHSLWHDSRNGVDGAGSRRDDTDASSHREWDACGHGLDRAQIARYSRQIVLKSFGIHGAAWAWCVEPCGVGV